MQMVSLRMELLVQLQGEGMDMSMMDSSNMEGERRQLQGEGSLRRMDRDMDIACMGRRY